jgi:glycosyltransferase involved in cell wall biosynthesis
VRVLIVSYAFAPSIGGVETASQMLAEELQRRGHEVAVVTATECAAPPSFSYPVHFQPSPWRLLALHRWADVVLHNSMSLRFAWPLLLHPRKWAIVHTATIVLGLFAASPSTVRPTSPSRQRQRKPCPCLPS